MYVGTRGLLHLIPWHDGFVCRLTFFSGPIDVPSFPPAEYATFLCHEWRLPLFSLLNMFLLLKRRPFIRAAGMCCVRGRELGGRRRAHSHFFFYGRVFEAAVPS